MEQFLSKIKLRARCYSALQFEFTQFLSLIYFRQSPQGVHCHITVCSACKCILKHISSVYGTESPKGVYHFGHEHTKWLSKSQMDLAKRDARHHFHHVFIEISAICFQFSRFVHWEKNWRCSVNLHVITFNVHRWCMLCWSLKDQLLFVFLNYTNNWYFTVRNFNTSQITVGKIMNECFFSL